MCHRSAYQRHAQRSSRLGLIRNAHSLPTSPPESNTSRQLRTWIHIRIEPDRLVFVIVCEGGPLMLKVSGQHSLGPLRSGFRRCVAVNLEGHLDSGSWALCISAVGKSGDLRAQGSRRHSRVASFDQYIQQARVLGQVMKQFIAHATNVCYALWADQEGVPRGDILFRDLKRGQLPSKVVALLCRLPCIITSNLSVPIIVILSDCNGGDKRYFIFGGFEPRWCMLFFNLLVD